MGMGVAPFPPRYWGNLRHVNGGGTVFGDLLIRGEAEYYRATGICKGNVTAAESVRNILYFIYILY